MTLQYFKKDCFPKVTLFIVQLLLDISNLELIQEWGVHCVTLIR